MLDEKDKIGLKAAIEEARKGLEEGGIPIGSSLFRDGKLLGSGHNRRVQDGNPVFHAEITCLHNAGRIGTYQGTTLYSTLMPCYLCAGAVVQFGIPRVVVGEDVTFPGSAEFLKSKGVEVVVVEDGECIAMMEKFIRENPVLWNEDIGQL